MKSRHFAPRVDFELLFKVFHAGVQRSSFELKEVIRRRHICTASTVGGVEEDMWEGVHYHPMHSMQVSSDQPVK